jgi:hypothetical protein
MEAFGVVVEELMLAVLDMGALDLFGGLVALLVFTPSLIRRMSTWVVGVPLPGWKLSAFMTT